MRFLMIGFLLALPAVKLRAQDDAKKEQEKLQGVWMLHSLKSGDGGLDKHLEKDGRVVIRGNKITFFIVAKDDKVKVAEFTFSVDPAKSPKAMDVTWDFYDLPGDKDNEQWKKNKGKTFAAIYALEGDILKIHADQDSVGGKRPRKFPKKEGAVIFLKRGKN